VVLPFLVLSLVTACGASGEATEDSLPADVQVLSEDGYHGALLTEPYAVSKQPLRDTDGGSYSLATDSDKPLTLVFFGYTKCPDTCQIVMSSLAAALTRLAPADRAQVDVVLVTTDPARDDEDVLRAYLDRLDPTFIGLTGSLADIRAVATPLKVFIEKGIKLPSGGYEVEHGTPVIGVDHTDRASIVWTEGTSASQFAEDINALLQQGATK
jgi:protein SCO1